MKLRFIVLALLFLATRSLVGAQPFPARQQSVPGVFSLSELTAISSDSELHPLADYVTGYLQLDTSSVCKEGDGEIRLALSSQLDAEEFMLNVMPLHVEITGGDYGGVFNGIQAFFRLLPSEVYAKSLAYPVDVAGVAIADKPRFPYRGMMLDVARTWMNADQVKRYIDLFSYHGINKLHLHLTDDEGWRIEIKSHPELTEIGGFRGGDSPVRPVYGKWFEKYGGYYTQDEIIDLINYAAARNIEIIPEIELPGHSRNIASVHPEIRCNFPPDTVSANGYDYRSAWCVAREENYTLLEDILGEVCALFPTEYIHVGGDEVDLVQWNSCPDCKALMKREEMTDAFELEVYFMKRVAAILVANGKHPGVWNEVVRTGELSRDTRVYGWKNVASCLDATTKGYSTVVMPGQYFYFDMRQTPHEEGHDWAAIFDAKKVYGFDFTKLGFSAEQLKNVVGLEAVFFSEAYISHEPEKPDYLDYMLFPRVCALSTLTWSNERPSWDTYYDGLKSKHYDRMAAMGIRFRLFPPKLSYAEGKFTVTTDDGSDIFYLKGDSPVVHPYLGPLATDKPHLFRFFSRYKTGRSPFVADKSYYRTIFPVVTITTSMGQDKLFPITNASRYRGLSRTARACRQGDWVLYTFDAPVKCREMFLQSGNRQLPKTIITTGYAEVSYDGVIFERAGDLDKGSIMLHPERAVKAVRLISTCDDNGTPYVTVQAPIVKPVL